MPDSSLGDLPTTADTAAVPPPPSGTLTAPPGYVLGRELGRGGMGVVHLATQVGLNRSVALKMVQGADPKAVIRFLAEAEAVASVRHPNVVEVYQYGDHDGRPFLAMEYCPGGVIGGERCPPADAARLMAAVADGVAAAHAVGVVHRDLKPGNVLLAADGTPKVTDFGLAKRGDSELTRTNAVLGTPAYMPPEQARGDTKFVGPPADVWALGVMLYEMLTGRRPFVGDTPWDLMATIQRGDFPRPRTLSPAVPRDLEQVCLKCLAAEPHRRYPTAAELAADLRNYLAGRPVTARPAGPLASAGKWVRRHPTAATLVGVVLAGLVAGIALQTRHAGRLAAALTHTDAALADARTSLYFNRVAFADRAFQAGDLAQVRLLLDDCPADLRGWEWTHLDRLLSAERLAVNPGGGQCYAVATSADGKRFATVNARVFSTSRPNAVVVWDADSGAEVCRPAGHAHAVAAVRFSPDGRWLAGAMSGVNLEALIAVQTGRKPAEYKPAVVVWEAATGKLVATLAGDTAVGWSPDSGTLAVAGPKNVVQLYATGTWAAGRTFTGLGKLPTTLAFTPDGMRLAAVGLGLSVISPNNTNFPAVLRLWDVATGEAVATRTDLPLSGGSAGLAFTPDGQRLVAADRRGLVRVLDGGTLADRTAVPGHVGMTMAVAVSTDGKRAASGGTDLAARVWSLPDGAEVAVVRGVAGAGIGFLGSDRLVVGGGDDKFRVWDAADGQGPRTLVGPTTLLTAVAIRPGGRELAAGGADGKLRVFDLATGSVRLSVGVPATRVVYTPDGKTLVVGGGNPFVPTAPGVVTLLDADTGKSTATLTGHSRLVFRLAVSRDGRRLVSLGGLPARLTDPGEVRVWELPSGRPVWDRTFPALVMAADFHPAGDRLTVAALRPGDGPPQSELLRLDAATGQTVDTLAVTDPEAVVSAVAYRPDGGQLAVARVTGGLELCDPDSGRPAHTVRGHEGPIEWVGYHPAGDRLATATMDVAKGMKGEVKLWSADGRAVLTLPGLMTAGFGPDGATLAAPDGGVGGPSRVRVWGFR